MKQTVHITNVKIDREVLASVVKETQEDFVKINDPKRLTSQGRSLFSRYNNISHMNDRLFSIFDTESEKIISLTGEATPEACARVYYSPSLTSMAVDFRKAIVPTVKGNKFIFFDLKAAEFFLACYFAGMSDVVEAYMRGEDIYDLFKGYFPDGTPRSHYKVVLLAGLYGGTSYSTSKRLGISESAADRLHASLKKALPKLEEWKNRILSIAFRTGQYRYPTNLEQTEFQIVPYKEDKGKVGFNASLAISVYVQSALGQFMQNLIKKTEERFGKDLTLLTVFDSLLHETSEERIEEEQKFFEKEIYPFRADKFSVGDSFYEVHKLNK